MSWHRPANGDRAPVYASTVVVPYQDIWNGIHTLPSSLDVVFTRVHGVIDTMETFMARYDDLNMREPLFSVLLRRYSGI